MLKREWMDKIDEMTVRELSEAKRKVDDVEKKAYIETSLALKNAVGIPDLWPAFRTKIAEKAVKKSPAVFRLKWPLAVAFAVFLAVAGLWITTGSETKTLSDQDFVLTTYTEIAGVENTDSESEETAMDYYYAIATQ